MAQIQFTHPTRRLKMTDNSLPRHTWPRAVGKTGSRLLAVGSLCCMALLTACSGHKETVAPSSADAEGTTDNASCSSDPRVKPYAANMQVTGDSHALTFTLVAATPAPPAMGMNSWDVTVAPVGKDPSSAYSLSVAPYMPDHGHGPSTSPKVTLQASTYKVSGIDFFMTGVWRVTFTAKDASGANVDSANLFFCVPG